MIPAREINLGNIMIHPNSGEPCVIEPQDMLSIMERELNGYNQNYEPIPLDAEWLERFSFKQVKLDRTPFYELTIENIKFIYYAGNLDFGVMGISQYEFVRMPKIKYVHQLQNLYYCLTHTELTKKEI